MHFLLTKMPHESGISGGPARTTHPITPCFILPLRELSTIITREGAEIGGSMKYFGELRGVQRF